MNIADNNFQIHFDTKVNFFPREDMREADDVSIFGNNNYEPNYNPEKGSNFAPDVPMEFEDGVSVYIYKDAKFSVYKDKHGIKNEFYCPSGMDEGEFFSKLDTLKPKQYNPTPTAVKDNSLGINGEIDETVIQGATGDCWIISALKSLSSTESGRNAIKNSIQVNDDNSVTVKFNGIGLSYTLTPEEIMKYDTDNIKSDAYSNGDNDVLAFELATEKLWSDIAKGKVSVDNPNRLIANENGVGGIDAGSLPSQFIYYLTGQKSYEYFQSENGKVKDIDKTTLFQILESAKNDKDAVLTFGVYNNLHTGNLTNGDKYTLDVGNGGHALSITKVDDGTVTFVNPWDTSKEYTMTWDEFADIGIGYLSYTQVEPNTQALNLPNENAATFYNAPNHHDENIYSYYAHFGNYSDNLGLDDEDFDFLKLDELFKADDDEEEEDLNKFSYLYNIIMKYYKKFNKNPLFAKSIFKNVSHDV